MGIVEKVIGTGARVRNAERRVREVRVRVRGRVEAEKGVVGVLETALEERGLLVQRQKRLIEQIMADRKESDMIY